MVWEKLLFFSLARHYFHPLASIKSITRRKKKYDQKMEQMKYQVYFLFYKTSLSSTVLVVITSSSSKICQCDKLWKHYLLILSRKFLLLHQGAMTHQKFWEWSRFPLLCYSEKLLLQFNCGGNLLFLVPMGSLQTLK